MSLTQYRVYIDTMVFLNHLFNKEHPLHSISARFFLDIENQKYVGITSSFTRSEYLGVIKQLMAEGGDILSDQSKVNNTLKIFDEFIDEMGIEYYDSDELASTGNLFSDSSDRISTSVPIRGRDKTWRALNGADSLLLIFAERTGSNSIATNDDGFKGTTSFVKPLVLREIY